ncbi:hypothetical protein BXY39_0239 [Eilatimonas milleporae]|uniref:Uncharacterized protein n=1 Tax=Eilatimonas milleporae TaxID=911205 RepID=A0A3M0CWQ1_9PROT|nr:hypothetical protein BXY39_0239 [Eilatimonas milleporae]
MSRYKNRLGMDNGGIMHETGRQYIHMDMGMIA